jgi:hypothetical protein
MGKLPSDRRPDRIKRTLVLDEGSGECREISA